MQMQRFEGVICNCCGEVLGSNAQCGLSATSVALGRRPPCLWAHADASIVQRCISAMKKAGTNEVKAPDVSVMPNDTPVFIPPFMGGYGYRGVVAAWNSKSKQYSIRFENGNVGSVAPHMLLRYIDKENMSLYPSDALPFDSSVRCCLGEKLSRSMSRITNSSVLLGTVCGIIQGAAIDDSNRAVYYDVGRNSTPKQFFIAADISLVEEEQVQTGGEAHPAPSAAPPGSTAPSAAARDSSAPSASAPRSSDPSAAPMVPRTFAASQFDEDDSDTDCGSVSATLQVGDSVVCDGKGLGIILGRCVNSQDKRVSKYIVQCNNSILTLRWNSVQRAPPANPKAGKSAPKATKPQALGEAPGSATLQVPTSQSSKGGKGKKDKRNAKGAPPQTASSQSKAGVTDSSSSEEASGSGHSVNAATEADDDAAKRYATPKKSRSKRQRAAKFNFLHDEPETVTIFNQLSSNIPWLHTRSGQKAIWKFHLEALQSEGHALELQGHKDAVKTFSSWAAHICKTRRTHRLAEMRKSGVATFEHDAVDDVAYRWEVKMCGDAADTQLNQQRAALFRDVATSSAVSLQATADKIEANRARRYSTKRGDAGDTDVSATPRSSKSATPSNQISPRDNAKIGLLRQLTDMATVTAEQDAKDAALVTQLISGMRSEQPASVPSCDGEVLLLSNFLRLEDSSLVNWAPQIHSALGITEGAHFAELTADDINNAPGIPVLQKRRLLAVGIRFKLQQ